MSANENNSNNSNVNNLNSFQSKSRLHFIGSWSNEATGMIRKIFEQHPEYDHSAFFSEQQLVCHIDMDCFFVLVALSKPENAHLRGKPVAVASGGNMSEISSCSYKAREFGLRAGMWLHQAKKLCPELQLVKYDFDRVRVINNMVYKAAFECCPHGVHMKLQVVSVDEFFVAFDSKDFDVARIFCENLRRRIFEESNGCTASCGVAPNVHVARAVTDLAKPDGMKIVTSAECLAFVREMAVDSIHGVGRKMQEKIKEMCILEKIEPSGRKTVKQNNNNVGNKYEDTSSTSDDDDDDENALMMLPARRERQENEENKQPQQLAATVVVEKVMLVKDLLPFSLDKLKKHLGNAMAEKLYNLAHKALDHTLVVGTGTSDSNSMPKAVGTSMNYAIRLNQIHEFSALLLQLCKDIASKLDRVGGAALIVKLSVLVRHPDAPIQTAKHLGCGWTNEFLLGQAKAISNDVAFVTAEKMHDTLMPFALGSLKVVAAKLNNNHTINNNGQGKASGKNDDDDDDSEEGLLPLLDEDENDNSDENNNSSAKPKPNYYWGPSKKVTMQQDSEPILITDLRGISLHASSIIPRPKAKISMTGKKIQAQMSIADSFRQIQQKTSKSNNETLEKKKNSASTSSKPFTLSDDDDEGDDNENDILVIDDDVVEEGDESKNQRKAIVGGKHKHDNRNNKNNILLLLSQTSNDSDDGIEILPQQKKLFNHKNANNARNDSSVILVGSQEDEDDHEDVRGPAKNMSHSKIQISKGKTEPGALEQKDINDESRSPCFRVDRNNPLSQMALVLVALRNGKILNILESKDPLNTDLRKLAARIVLDENAMPKGMQLLGGGNKRKFTTREIDAAKRVLGR